jgi:hypothetical protein
MKKGILFAAFIFAIASCSPEKRIVDATVTHIPEIEAMAKKLYSTSDTEYYFTKTELGALDLTKKEKRLLKKLKSEEIHLLYTMENPADADSLVIFTRGGLWIAEHTVIVDMKKKARKNLPGCIKLSDRVYYRRENAVIPIS